MPEPSINATKDLREDNIDETTHKARIAERTGYRIWAKSLPDADGHVRLMCPAAGPLPLVRCALEPASEGGDGKVRTRIPVTDSLAAFPPKIRSQQSITLPPDAGAKFLQPLAHASEEWHRTYATLRNSNEGMNGFVKDGAHEAVDDPERRRIRGVAAQSVLVAFQLFAANIRKIDEFMMTRATRAKSVRKLPSRRKTASIKKWAPNQSSPVVASPSDSSGDPDPPLPT
jgi:hypothetical protein